MVVTEYLPGKEYTIDCFTKSNGELIFCQGRIRERISNGISVRTRPVSDSRFLDLALKISKKLKFSGMWFFQVKEGKNNVLTLLEIAPRIAGTMGMYRVKGINFVQLSLFDLLGNDVKIIDNKFNLISDRALYSCYKTDLKYDYVYVDYDDTLVNNDLVNSFVIKFLYQSLNQGKKIYLITRHGSDLKEDLERHKISDLLFTDIIRITDKNEKKSKYITHKKSILIDDSFAERYDVHTESDISVFSVDQLEVLIEHRN